MPVVVEQVCETPLVRVHEDRANNGVRRAIVGIEVTNTAARPVTAKVASGATVLNWWTPLGRVSNVIRPGEAISSTGWKVPAGATDAWSVAVGEE